MLQIAKQFRLEGTPLRCEAHGHGHINHTYLVTTDTENRYILQKINGNVFPRLDYLMENISRVTRFIADRVPDPRMGMRLVPTVDGEIWLRDGEDSGWRVYEYVERSFTLQAPESPADFYQSAVGFGRFQSLLAEFPAETLHETIEDFHNTPFRLRQFRQAVEEDRAGRAASVRAEIDFLLERASRADELQLLLQDGKLPLRVTHNDTKLNNVLFDSDNRTALCVIDLDTVMPGLVAYDFGDAIRFGASTGAEDEPDWHKVALDMGLFETYTRGFLENCPPMTETEAGSLATGAWMITYEQALRFLADYLNGDVYYATHRPGQNLDRTRTQLALLADMERNREAMESIVYRIYCEITNKI